MAGSTAPIPVTGSPAERFAELRRRHPRFVYEGFEVSPPRTSAGDAQHLKFLFRLEADGGPAIDFVPETIIEEVDWERWRQIPMPVLENLFFHLGLIESLSYWKAACSPEIIVEGNSFDDNQAAWFLNLLRRGMGEYFYVNRIDWRAPDFVRIAATRDSRFGTGDRPQAEFRNPGGESRTLLLTSGGKDSVVTLETLRAAGQPFDCLILNPTKAALDVAKQAGCEKPIIVRRTIDRRLLQLNAAGYLNGHTPFSALLAFLGVTVAALFGYRRVIVSNERSAEEATVEYLGAPINHQYSKTYEFETSFREYCRKYLTPEIEYFSLLRPLYELQIAQRFAKYPQYFSLFRSCNRGQASNSWCGQCPKCLFVWTALYPFVERQQLLDIFQRDLFAVEEAAETMRHLLGLDAAKPFECVGTKDETLAAVHLCVEKYMQQGIALPPALETIRQTVLASRPGLPALARSILSSWSDEHRIPAELTDSLRRK